MICDDAPRLDSIRTARWATFATSGIRLAEESDIVDIAAWHVVALEKPTGHVMGGVRLVVLDRRLAAVQPADILRLGDVAFTAPAIEQVYRHALTALLWQAEHKRFFVYVGGLFVVSGYHSKGLGTMRILAANALFRIHHWRSGPTIDTMRKNAVALFTRLGGYRLTVQGEDIPPFFCTRHLDQGQLLGLNTFYADPRFDSTIATLAQRMCAQLHLPPGDEGWPSFRWSR